MKVAARTTYTICGVLFWRHANGYLRLSEKRRVPMTDPGSERQHVLTKAAVNLNGITIAYVMGLVNALFAVLLSYGVHLNDQEIAATVGLINAGLVLAVHMGHRVGEATASGASEHRSAQRFDSIQIAAERRGVQLHDASPEVPPTSTGPAQG